MRAQTGHRRTIVRLIRGALYGVLAAVAPLSPAGAPVHGYRVVREYPHDPSAFTQGLVYVDGHLYESTGLLGASSLRQVDLETGQVIRQRALGLEDFGEGLTDWGERLLQLTWTGMHGFIYERASFALSGTFHYAGEGWGLTHDGRRLILSDGTAVLRFLDPETFHEIGRLPVHDEGRAVRRLNELEYVRGEVYANVWQTDWVARISPETGAVLGWIDLAGLLSAADTSHPVDVLNGIAYDPERERLFVTGKWWPKLFEIMVGPASPSPPPQADLALSQTDAPDPVIAGEQLTDTLTVRNQGPASATGVIVTDDLPAGVATGPVMSSQGACTGTDPVVCPLGTLSRGASATVTIRVVPAVAGAIGNQASVRANETDPVPGNNSASITTTVHLVALALSTPQIRCTRSVCRVQLVCNALGTPCNNRVTLFVRVPSSRVSDDPSTRAQRRIRFATDIAKVPPGPAAKVGLALTEQGKEIARQLIKNGTKKLRGVIEIRNVAVRRTQSTPARVRLR